MDEDLVKHLGYANLDTRFKRISDKMSHSLRSMYRDLDIDTEPNWYLVLWIVNDQPNISVMEIANRLKFTHQSVVSMTNKMIKQEYLLSEKDHTDKRKTIFRLTQKAENSLPLFTQIWEAGKRVTLELLNQNTEIMHHLDLLESNLEDISFGERIANELKEDKQ